MAVDALSSIASSLLGTSTSGAFIESATGIRDGARTGLASVATGTLFLATLFVLPAAGALQSMRFAYAPALVAVGLLMLGAARRVEFDDLAEAVPAFATIALALFTYNIANGVTAGLVLAPLAKSAAGRVREVRAGAWVLAAAAASYLAFGLRH